MHGGVRYDFIAEEMPELEEESEQVSRRARGSMEGSTTVTLGAVPVLLRADCRRGDISAVRRNHE